MNLRVQAADSVYAPEPLNNANRIPVNIIIDEQIAVLKVLPLRNAVCGNQSEISSFCGIAFILARFLERGEKLIRIWLNSALPNVLRFACAPPETNAL